MTTKITITQITAGAVLKDATGDIVRPGEIDLADDAVLTVEAQGAWSALVCNESPDGAHNVETIIKDDADDYETHHLKPHGGWSLGWSVVLVGDPGDYATIRALST